MVITKVAFLNLNPSCAKKNALIIKSNAMQKMNSFKNPNFTYASPPIFDSIKSIESEQEEHHHRRNTRRRLIIIFISSALLLLLVVGAVVVPSRATASKEQQSIKSICNVTLYQESCYSTIYSLKHTTKNSNPNPDTPNQIFILSLQVTLNELIRLKSSPALNACSRQIQDSVDHVNMSVISLQPDNVHQFQQNWAADVRTWLSTAITDQKTCLNDITEFANVSLSIQREIAASMANATIFTSNSLAIVSNIPDVVRGSPISIHKKIMQEKKADLRPDLTVAKDGSGDYETITEAVNAMPKKSKRRFSIYVKRGEYKENVLVGKDSWNLMMYGDGMEKTVVSSNLNYADGIGTYDSGTLSLEFNPHAVLNRAVAEGRGFIARDMGFKNTAGPEKFQAVAVRSSSDRSIFYRCLIDGYQDTLYVHSNRQFYRECIVTGTIDFIFGNAASVFQNCSIQAKQPLKGQYNTITAQSKSDPNQNTGFSIQRCSISPRGNLTARTYFGRPWNVYSTAVVLKTEVEGIIDPEGWSAWEPGTKAPDSIFYAEYKNDGPGSGLSGRVKWPGYRPGITDEEAEKFSVEEFIQGKEWLEGLNIGYDPHI